jgi:tRNA(Ile)-lysidine synthase
VAGRDVAPLLARQAALLGDEDELLDDLAAGLDPTDARAVAAAPPPLARRALRRWLRAGGYPPDSAAVARVLAVAAGAVRATEVGGGRRVSRRDGRLRLHDG